MEPDQPTNKTPESPLQRPEQLSGDQPQRTPEGAQPETSAPPQTNGKKSKKPLIIAIAVIIVIAAVATAYAVFAVNQKNESSSKTDKKQETVKDVATDNPDVNVAKSLLTDISASENSLADSDQSDLADEINSAAGTVGSSVDENDF